jgi:hypothetical protein
MDFFQKLAREAENAVREGFSPPQRPACAYFVSQVMLRAGWEFKNGLIGWVPGLADLSVPVGKPAAGDLVIFAGTYDALSPAGIGPEDDFTHVGILTGMEGGRWRFAHYSAVEDRPVMAVLSGYWQEHLQEFRRLPSPAAAGEDSPPRVEGVRTALLKIFFHPDARRPVFVIDGKEEPVMELLLAARTKGGRVVNLTSHPFEACPALQVDDTYYPVRYMGSKGIEYLVASG